MDAEIKDALSPEFLGMLDRIEQAIAPHGFVRIITHYDADGISASGVLAQALRRAGKLTHVTFCKSLDIPFIEELVIEKDECVFFLDQGSQLIDSISELAVNGATVAILDHHRIQETRDVPNVIHLNCNLFGIDGMGDACASTLAFLVALRLSQDNWDLAGYYLAGALGDKQHLQGFSGVNKAIVEVGKKNGVIEERTELNMVGETVKDGVLASIEPVFLSLTAKEGVLDEFLKMAKVPPDTPLLGLDGDRSAKVRSILALALLKQNVSPEVIDRLVAPRFFVKGKDIKLLSYIIDSCGRSDKMGLGFLITQGSAKAFETGNDLYKGYVKELHKILARITKEGAKGEEAFQYFYTRDDEASLAGTLAELTLDYVFDHAKPVFALTKKGHELKISARGTKALLNSGLDLSKVCFEAAKAAKGQGGGHPIAAGATVPVGEERPFLEKANAVIRFQLA